MKHYILRFDRDLFADGPFTSDGRYFDYLAPEIENAEKLVAIIRDEYDIEEDGELPDVISFLGSHFCISQRFYQTLLTTRIAPEIRSISIGICDHNDRQLSEYVFLWSPRSSNETVLDRNRALVEYYKDSRVVYAVRKWAFDESKIPPYDIFGSVASTWIGSEDLKKLCEENNINNVSFEAV